MASIGLFDLLNREGVSRRSDLIVALAGSAAANTAILAIINEAALKAGHGASVRLLALFIVAGAIYAIGLLYTFRVSTQVLESALANIRMQLADKIARAELTVVQDVGAARILRAVTQDTSLISESQGLLVAAAHSAVMVAFTSVYVVTISLPAFLTIVGVIAAGVLLYGARERRFGELMRRSIDQEVMFVGLINHLIEGLKEVRLSRARRDELRVDIEEVTKRLRDLKIESTGLYNENAVFSQGFFYTLLGVIVFVLPAFLQQGSSLSVPQLLATVLFIFGPLSTIVTALPAISKANRAIDSLMRLEAELSELAGPPPVEPAPRQLRFRSEFGARGLTFHYPSEDQTAFSIGPLDLTLKRGEVTMFVGGNGSGKTTLLKLLAGLYPLDSGELEVDGRTVTPARLHDYRNLFGAIYSDFHLFPKLYGVPAERDDLHGALERMRIHDKVGYGELGFSSLELSTGQRKRLAMAVTLLEDRPILIFDEWAAEQDPEFRAFFYEHLLPELRKKDKALLVATHDDRYFDLADCRITMELGQITSVRRRRAR